MSYFKKQRSLGADGSSSGETPGIINVITDLFNLDPVLPPPQPAYGTQPGGAAPPIVAAPPASSSLFSTRNLLIGGAAVAGLYFLTRKR